MTNQQPRQPQAVPQDSAVDSDDERDDGPDPLGVMLLLCLGMALLIGVGLMLMSFAQIDRLVWASGLVR